ncbi:MAG: IPT/TIG domain-containing protein, partial [Candidatus Hydrogenedentota bacterium]
TDRHTKKVLRANLNGSKIETLIDESKTAIRIPIGLTLELGSKKMYWSDPATRTIQRANLDGTKIEEIVPAGQYRPLGLEFAAIQPESGPKKGGRRIAIIGSNFVPGKTTVHFGKLEATKVEVVTPHLLQATTPRAKHGNVNLTVTTPAGKTIRANSYKYVSNK